MKNVGIDTDSILVLLLYTVESMQNESRFSYFTW